MATRETVKKIEALESRNCDIFGRLIWRARMKGNQTEADEFRHKLRGYLTALEDVGILTRRELQEAYLWYATVKNYGEEEDE